MARSYELNALFSKKFEELDLRGAELVTRAGKKGTEPTPQVQTFPDAAAAARRYLARIAQLEKEKFVRAYSAAPVAPLARNPALEVGLFGGADPHAWAVYADWVQSQGHLLGELAAVQQRAEPEVARAFLLNAEDALFGEVALQLAARPYFKPCLGELEWEHGFLRHARLGTYVGQKALLEEQAAQFLALPVARFITRLTFGPSALKMANDDSPLVEALLASEQAQRLESLFLGDFEEPNEQQMSWSGLGDVSRVWELRGLQHLRLRGGEMATLGKIDAPSLRSFTRESGGLAASELQSIVDAHWPNLERLELWTGSEEYGAAATVDVLKPVLDGRGLPKLKSLALRNSQITNELILALADSAILPQLERLDLSLGTMDADGAQRLLVLASRFRHLQVFDLRDNLICGPEESQPSQERAQLNTSLPNALVDPQRDLDWGEAALRFVAVGE